MLNRPVALLFFCLYAALVCASEADFRRIPRKPLAQWEAGTDIALVEWTDVEQALINALPASGPWHNRLIVDGEKAIDVPSGTTSYQLKLERGEQHDVMVEFRGTKGELVHRTEPGLLEITTAQTIQRSSFDGFPLPEVHLPKAANFGVNDELTRTVVDISREKVAWLLRPGASPALRAVPPHLLDVTVKFSASGQPLAVQAFDREHGVVLRPSADEFFVKVDAAFNGNSFFWDDMFISQEAAWHQPLLAAATLDFWYAIQNETGGGVIPREVRKQNRISYNPATTILVGKTRENGAYTNPNLSGWTEWQLFALRGPRGSARLRPSIRSLQAYLKWLQDKRHVAGTELGLWQDNLGSGMDNLPRGGGEYQPDANSASIWVDLMSQEIAMYREMARMHAALGEWKESESAAAEAMRIADYLNAHHWSGDGGFYFDRIPDGQGGLKLDTATSTIAGFWPLWAGAATGAHADEVAERQLVEGRFGGEFPLPALSESHPLYSDQGHYWQGGRWPNAASMAIQGFENAGRPDVAFELTRRFLRGMSEVSDEYAANHARGTVYEFYGVERLNDGHVRVRPGLEPGHFTREDFAGWGAVPPVYNMLRHWVGLRPVPGFAGAVSERGRWLNALEHSPVFRHTHFLSPLPAKAARGYLEWNLMLDPKDEPLEVRNIRFHDRAVERLAVQRIGSDRYRLTVQSETPFLLQLNRLYDEKSGQVASAPLSAAALTEIGGERKTKTIELKLISTK